MQYLSEDDKYFSHQFGHNPYPPNNSDAQHNGYHTQLPSDRILHYIYGAHVFKKWVVNDIAATRFRQRKRLYRPPPPLPDLFQAPFKPRTEIDLNDLEHKREGRGEEGREAATRGGDRSLKNVDGHLELYGYNLGALTTDDAQDIILKLSSCAPAAQRRRAAARDAFNERIESWAQKV